MIARRVALLVRAVVAEPPRPAVAPALDAATNEDRAGVLIAGRDGDGVGAEVDGAQAGHLARGVALVVRAVVAEPPSRAPKNQCSPALLRTYGTHYYDLRILYL